MESLSVETADFLKRCIQAELNILVSGGTGTGKTTLLNALSTAIPDDDRIITIEDSAELRLNQRHVLRLECRPSNVEGEGAVEIRDLVRNSLRMRPDRIIVGEVRGAEALDMLQAMNTGHDGSLCTAHANSARDALARIETMVLMAGYDLPLRAIRQQVCSALDLIVHLERIVDGSRRVTTITEVQRMESDVIGLQPLFEFKVERMTDKRSVIGSLRSTGLRPTFLDKFEKRDIKLPAGLFQAPQRARPRQLRPMRRGWAARDETGGAHRRRCSGCWRSAPAPRRRQQGRASSPAGSAGVPAALVPPHGARARAGWRSTGLKVTENGEPVTQADADVGGGCGGRASSARCS